MKQANIASILRLPGTVFSFKELVLTFNEKRPDLLRKRLSNYVKKGELYRIRRGLYAKDKNYNKHELATKIYTPAYVSFETILVEAGIVFQYYRTIFVATYQTREIKIDGYNYSFKKIKGPILVCSAGVENKGHYYAATKERAILDILYLNMDYHFDNLYPVDWNKINEILPIYKSKRMVKKVQEFYKAFKEDEGEDVD